MLYVFSTVLELDMKPRQYFCTCGVQFACGGVMIDSSLQGP